MHFDPTSTKSPAPAHDVDPEHRRSSPELLPPIAGPRSLAFLAALPAALLLLFHAARYFPIVADDALISLRYADRLVAGKGLTWTDGDRVEGYSNLTWVLANALLHLLGIDLVVACRLLGAAGLLGTLWCVASWERAAGERGLFAGALAASAAALTGTCAVWLVGGLEQPLVVLLLGLALLSCRAALEATLGPERAARRADLRAASIYLALLCLSRPDGALLSAAVIAAYGLALGRSSLSACARLAWPCAAAVLAQLAFRLLYYHDWVPNTARAKLSLSGERLHSGLVYLQQGAEFLWPLGVVAVLSTVLARRFSRSLLLVWLPLVVWLVYLTVIGGDFFPGRRLLLPVVVLLAFAIASGVTGILRSLPRPMLALVPCFVLLALQVPLTWFDPENTNALIAAPWAANDRVIGRLFKTAFEKAQPLLAVDGAGSLPFYSELPALDILGLNDRYLALHPPPDFGKYMIGHELGDGAYVYRRRPDLLVICMTGTPPLACFRPDRELLERADFQREYQLLRFRGRDPYPFDAAAFVRREGKIGMSTRGGELRVPGFLLAGNVGVAALDPQGRMGAELPANVTTELELPLDCTGRSVLVESTPPVQAELASARTLRITTTAPTHVRQVKLRR
jgi:arabinofuranosyltransferase